MVPPLGQDGRGELAFDDAMPLDHGRRLASRAVDSLAPGRELLAGECGNPRATSACPIDCVRPHGLIDAENPSDFRR